MSMDIQTQKKYDRYTAYQVALCVIMVLIVLIPTWWWAFNGLSQNVGTAIGITDTIWFILTFAGCFALTDWKGDLKRGRR